MNTTYRAPRTRTVSAGLLAATAALLSACQDNREPVAPRGAATPSADVAGSPGVLNASPDNILFVRTLPDGNGEIYTMTQDGQGQTRLTYNVAYDGQPVYSPDRSKVAFVSYRTGRSELFVMDADGGNVKQLTFHNVQVTTPAWSPDGTKIAFTSSHVSPYGIFVINADGTGEKLISNNYDSQPSYSPDGTKIAFVTSRSANHQQHIYMMNADGTGQKQLYYGYAQGWQEMQPHWSPDGTKILFVWYSYSDARIYTMETVGWPVTKLLVNSVAKEYDPSWSPDGSRIVFSSTRDGKYAVYRAHYNGWGQTRISPLTSSNSQSSWGR